MPIVKTYIPDTELYHDLKAMGRDNFSYDGAKALMEYLEQFSEDIGENIEYDPIVFCCDYSEYAESEYIQLSEEYSFAPKICDFIDTKEYQNDDDAHEAHAIALIEWLHEQTTVIEFNGGIIIQVF